MPTGPFLGALLSVLPGLTLADASVPSIPDTPAGHALASWPDAFNSGDSARLEAFDKARAPWLALDGEMGLRARTGGYDLLTIDKADKLWIVFRARSERARRRSSAASSLSTANNSDLISLLSLAPAGAKSAEIAVDDAERSRVIDGAAKLLDRFYVFPDVAKTTVTELRAQHNHGEYRGITDGAVFATRLTDDLRALGGDKHVAVDFFAKSMPPDEPTARPHPD